MAVRYRVLGALAPGPFAPLLADCDHAGRVRPVVLHRPGPVEVRALAALTSGRVVAEEGEVRVDGVALAVSPYAPGADLDHLDVPTDVVPWLAVAVLAALRDAAAFGLHHGRLDGSAIRVDRAGAVRVVGWRGGTERGDLDALADLFDAIGVDPGFRDAPSLDVQLPPAPTPTSWLATVPDAPVLHTHPLVGREIVDAPPTPPKARLAAVGAVTLALGIAAGAALRPVPVVLSVAVPDAAELVVTCGDTSVRSTSGAAAIVGGTPRCAVHARFRDDRVSDGAVDGTMPASYDCRPHGGDLTCSER